MKKFRALIRKHPFKAIVFFLLFFISLFIPITTGIVAKAETKTSDEALNQSIREQLEKLDLEALQEYVDSLGGFSDKGVAERLFDIIALVKRICNKAMILDHGKMLAFGDIDEIAEQYAAFIEDKVPKKKKKRKKKKVVKDGGDGDKPAVQDADSSKETSANE